MLTLTQKDVQSKLDHHAKYFNISRPVDIVHVGHAFNPLTLRPSRVDMSYYYYYYYY